MRSRVILLGLVVLGLIVAACGDGETSNPTPSTSTPPTVVTISEQTTTTLSTTVSTSAVGMAVTVVNDIPYSQTFGLNVYYPEESGEWPTAVVFHGGEVSKGSMADYARQVAAGGVVVFVPEFSSTPAQLAEVLHLGAEDGVCAMRYARAHASEFGGDGDRVVTAGLSYGAVVGALMTLAGDHFESDCLVEEDVTAMGDGFVGLDGLYDFDQAPEALGFHDLYTMEQLRTASATTYVETPARGDVRFVLFTGSNSAGQDQAELFRARLAEVGYQVEVLARPDVPHTVMFPTQAEGAVQALVEMASG